MPTPSSHFACGRFTRNHFTYDIQPSFRARMLGLSYGASRKVSIWCYPDLMTLILDAGRLHFPTEGRVRAEYRSGAPMPLSFRGKQASPNAYSAQSTKTR